MSDLDELYREIEAVVEELEAFIRGGSYPNYKMSFMLLNDVRILSNGVLPRLRALLPREETLAECVEWYLEVAPQGGGYGSHEARRRLRAALARERGR